MSPLLQRGIVKPLSPSVPLSSCLLSGGMGHCYNPSLPSLTVIGTARTVSTNSLSLLFSKAKRGLLSFHTSLSLHSVPFSMVIGNCKARYNPPLSKLTSSFFSLLRVKEMLPSLLHSVFTSVLLSDEKGNYTTSLLFLLFSLVKDA